MKSKAVYANNQTEAITKVRKTLPKKYIVSRARYAGAKHNRKVYLVFCKLRKK